MTIGVDQHACAGVARRAFTLVELLVTVAIIAMLAGIMVVAMASAQETARDAKTKAMIAKLNDIVMRRYDSYRTRRVPIQIPTLTRPAIRSTKAAAQIRLDALRQLMRMELPDRWSDIVDGPAPITDPQTGTQIPTMVRPAINQAYFAHYQALHGGPNPAYPDVQNQGAECLYLIVTLSGEDGARESFGEGEIGDTDGDGAPEFLDGWGRPISFLRWAPGFVSELQNGTDPDPFDPMHVYPDTYNAAPAQPQRTFALYPLIYSAGPDKIYDVQTQNGLRYSTTNNNPFFGILPNGGPDPNNPPAGLLSDQADPYNPSGNGALDYYDNIHNHLLGTK